VVAPQKTGNVKTHTEKKLHCVWDFIIN